MAKPRVKIPFLVFMSEIKKRSFTEKVKFSISFLLKNCNNLVYSSASAFRTETQNLPFCIKFDACNVLTGYVFGFKHSLQLKDSFVTTQNVTTTQNVINL